MAAVKNKFEYRKLYEAGKLGNRPRTWWSLSDLYASDYCGPINVRSQRANDKLMRYAVQFDDVAAAVSRMSRESGLPVEMFVFNETMDDSRISVQGELARLPHLEMKYSFERTRMRFAMKNGNRATGILPSLLIRQFADGQGQDDIARLLVEYPDSVIEFSCYELPVGLTGSNTIIWEVRNY